MWHEVPSMNSRLNYSSTGSLQGIPQPKPIIMEIAWGQYRRAECETANE